MFKKIRRRFTFANVTMTVALVFAMSGGAYAANRYLITSTKQISPKVLKALKGQNGSNGANGANGPAGPAGPQGAAGATGPQGPQGPAGAAGEPGAAGKNGTPGKTGSPWAAGGTLPKESTETGVWSIEQLVPEQELVGTSISFTIQLAAALDPAHVHFIQHGETPPAGCSGSLEEPAASSGNLCVFAKEPENAETPEAAGLTGVPPVYGFNSQGASKTGTGIHLASLEKGKVVAGGSWAVTG